MIDYRELIQQCEEDLRSGRVTAAAHRLKSLPPKDVPRIWLAPLANVSRRAQLDSLSLKLLMPVVRGERLETPPSAEEKAEYAATLQKAGAVNEAIDLLKSMDPAQFPQAGLFLAYCHFRKWDYAEAIPLLKDFIPRANSDYHKVVGELNLAAALAAVDQLPEALHLATGLIEKAGSQNLTRIMANALELRAQIYIANGDFAPARADLSRAARPGDISSPLDSFLVRKWSAVLTALEKKDLEELKRFRAEAEDRHDWESVREADFFSLKVSFNEELFNHLMFGTPHQAYRARVLKDLGREWTAENLRYGNSEGPVFSVMHGEFEGLAGSIPPKAIHQLLSVLLRDFYKPWSTGGLFSEVFPGQYYDIFSSPNRVHQLLWRLRRWMEENSLPVRLTEDHGQYQIKVDGPFAFVVPREAIAVDENVLQFKKLESHFPKERSFTRREAENVLGISASSFKRFAQWALQERKLERLGASRSTIYKIAS